MKEETERRKDGKTERRKDGKTERRKKRRGKYEIDRERVKERERERENNSQNVFFSFLLLSMKTQIYVSDIEEHI
jgi:hypothetical protein